MIVAGTGPDGQFEVAKVRIQMRPGMGREAARRDLAVLGPQLRPASKSAVAPIVAILKVRTKQRATGEQTAEFAADVLMQDLAAYPLDVVRAVCEEWPTLGEDGKWFPSWAELYQRCERRVQPRRALAKALQWVCDGEPENAL